MSSRNPVYKRSQSERIIFLGGTILFFLLAALSLIFWKERHAYDAAHYLLEIIIRKNFFIAHHRPAGVVSQVLPLLGIYLGMPLGWLMKLYSIGDILFYYLVFLWLIKSAKNYAAALTLLMSYLLTVCYSFYCPVTELLQGMALLPVVWVLFDRNFPFQLPVVFLLMSVIVFSHPLLFIPCGVMIGWWWNREKEKSGRALKILIGFIIITALKLLLLDKYDYQKTYYPVVFDDYSNLNNLTDSNYLLSFLKLLFLNYPVSVLVAFLTFVLLLIRKAYLQAGYLWLTIFCFLLIIVGTHRFGSIGNYSERMLLPLSFLVALPFSLELIAFKSERIKQLLLYSLMLFFLFRVNDIRGMSNDYTIRITQMTHLIHTSQVLGHQKVIAEEVILDQVPTANSGWCYSIETMLYSALEGPGKTVSVAMQHDHIDRIKEAGITLQPNQWIKWMEYILEDDTLPANYFKFTPQVYVPLRNEGGVTPETLASLSCTIEKPILYSRNGSAIITVRFSGIGKHLIPAKNVELRIRYNALISTVPLASDIVDNGTQQVYVSSEFENPEEAIVDVVLLK